MPIKYRPDPVVPDHVMLRKIGGGAYGEIWLGRGVTGALRAVKVVWREDFEDERGFEREFEGILKFEPISRSHPGLVNILHVGRGEGECGAFYYYVMELGDDMRSGDQINPVEYEPRTLRPDTRGAVVPLLSVAESIDVGVRLAEALEHLHGHGLAHRDVKPSNVIFVHGHAKLADIGLVAARGQRTFVGTEGFVPPEGPGSTQADVYGLGKVLYEIVTGKDRMDFPELPEELPSGAERKKWQGLNRIICDVCEPRISKRRITTATELADALRRLQCGRRRRPRLAGVMWLLSLLLLGFTAWVGWRVAGPGGLFATTTQQVEDPGTGTNQQDPPPKATGRLEVITYPSGADVVDESGGHLGTTPVTITGLEGERIRFEIRKYGYRPIRVSATVDEAAVRESQTVYRELKVFRPPERGDAWLDQNGLTYQPVADEHRSFNLVEEEQWLQFVAAVQRPAGDWEIINTTQNGAASRVVMCLPADAAAYCAWFREEAVKAGYLTEDHEVKPLWESGFGVEALSEAGRARGLKPFFLSIKQIDYAGLELTTEPAGAEVYVNGSASGITEGPLQLSKLRPGPVDIIVLKEGYRPHTSRLQLKPGENEPLRVVLQPSHMVVSDKPWQNGLGMLFVPVGELQVAAYETTISEYEVFLQESGHTRHEAPDFPTTPDHPVAGVSRADALAFCAWLTERERKPGVDRITTNHLYRLPSDLEWSTMAGVKDHPDLSPKWRNMHKAALFFWGEAWPPPPRSGNLADATAVAQGAVAPARAVVGYDDGFAFTAPVGSFPANANGLFDLEGNVLEWVADDYSVTDAVQLGVMRGGSWDKYREEHLFIGHREAAPAANGTSTSGFRVVLARVPVPAEPAVDDGEKPEPEPEPAAETPSPAEEPGVTSP